MIPNLPFSISLIFILLTIWAIIYIINLVKSSIEFRSKTQLVTLVLLSWLIIQGLLSYYNFYSGNTKTLPPRFALLIWPPLILIIILFFTKPGKRFIDSLPLVNITYFNMIRIGVELIFMSLLYYKAIPELMTFTGRNFDILAGITAPFIAYFGLQKHKLDRKVLLAWNFFCLTLLINIVINALLSGPFVIQQFAFDQPDIAVLYFPFSYLPALIVPAVLFGHLVSIRRILILKRL
ncbi:MAG TPA: hypothetical protein VK590_07260 [Saprospiraceae bacterium]|nr:hypothetical protein [Saprospiraceae bacterium]